MRYNSVLLILLISIMFTSPASAWADETRNHSAWIHVNNVGNATSFTNISVPLNITYDNDMNPNGSDILVYNETSGVVVPHWIDYWNSTNGTYLNLWFNATSVPGSAWNNNTYKLYYGNTSAKYNNTLGGYNTFPFFCDFAYSNCSLTRDTGAVDSPIVANGLLSFAGGAPVTDGFSWADSTQSLPVVYEIDVRRNTNVDATNAVAVWRPDSGTYNRNFRYYNLNVNWISDGGGSDFGVAQAMTQYIFYHYQIDFITQDNIGVYVNRTKIITDANPSNAFTSVQAGIGVDNGVTADFDNVRFRKFVNPDITSKLSSEEDIFITTWSNNHTNNNTLTFQKLATTVPVNFTINSSFPALYPIAFTNWTVNGVDQGNNATFFNYPFPTAGVYYVNATANISATNYSKNWTVNVVSYLQLYTPLNQSIQYYNYPPQSNTINFTWEHSNLAAQIQVAKDINFNILSVDTVVSNNYTTQPIQGTQQYWWKVRSYNSATGVYGEWSPVNNFLLQANNTASGTAIQGTVYEILSGTNTVVSGASVFIYNNTWSSTQVTGSNGYYYFNTGNGTYYLRASKTNYEDSELQTVNVTYLNISTQDILLEKCISGFNCFYNQKYVEFIVKNPIGSGYSDVAVAAYKGSDVTATYTGTTDDLGSWTELFFIGQQYRLTFIKASDNINKEITVVIKPNGQDDAYTLIIWGVPTTKRSDNISWNLSTGDNNATTSFLNFSYNSNTTTTSLNFWVKNDTGAVLYSANTAGVTSWTASFAVIDTANNIYTWGFSATHPTWGTFEESKVIRFRSQFLIDLHINDTRIYTWISIGFLTLLALLFSKTTNKYGYVLVPLFALFTWGVGWFPQGYQLAHFTLIMTTLVIGVLAYMRASEKKGAYPY